MKSFIGDEGYQAPRSPRLTEQEVYIVSYVVPVPPVSTILSGKGRPVWRSLIWTEKVALLLDFHFHFQ